MPTKTYGTVSAEQRKQMSGLEFVQGLADGTLPMNTIAKTLGYDIAEATVGRVVVCCARSRRRPGRSARRNIHSSFHGAVLREPGIHNPCGEARYQPCHRDYGFRACAKRRIPE
jgi:hypothetical protein